MEAGGLEIWRERTTGAMTIVLSTEDADEASLEWTFENREDMAHWIAYVATIMRDDSDLRYVVKKPKARRRG